MSRIKEDCIFHAMSKSGQLCGYHFCIIESKYIAYCPSDCRYFTSRVDVIIKLALELKSKERKEREE